MSVRKTVGAARCAAERVGLEWPDSSQSSVKRLKSESESGEEKQSVHLSDMIGS